nr:hypothetical protein [Tanacetum cinerariifolium]
MPIGKQNSDEYHKNHLLRFSIATSSYVPWIYMAQFWHTLKEDGSKYKLKFMLDRKELSLTLDDFRTIFHLPQATNNNHDRFVPPPSFFDMIPFYKNHLGFTMELETSSSFKLVFCNRGKQLVWKGIHYSLLHSTSSIPYQRFTKIIIGHYMTNFPEISRRARDNYHNLKDDDLMKNIFNSGRYKDKVGMKIPDWMISEAMKQTEHYRMYAEVFGIDVPLTQSQPTESTQGTCRTPSAPRYTRLTPPALVPTVDKADQLILQDTLQVNLAEHQSRQEQETRENVALVDEHLASVEIEKMVEGQENVIGDSSILRNNEHNIPRTRLEPRSDKESLEVEVTNVVIPVNVYDEEQEEDEITDEVYELKRMEKGKIVEESRNTPFPTPIRSPRIHVDLVSSDTEKLQELTGQIHAKKVICDSVDHLYEAMADSLLTMVDKHVKEQLQQQAPEQVRNQVLVYVAEGTLAIHPRDQDDPHDDAHPEGENCAKRQKTSEYEANVSRESSSGQDNERDQGPSTSGNQKQVDDYDFWTDSYASDDDEIPTKQVLQDIMEDVSLNIDEAKLKKIVNEMLRQRCTSGDEHQYHIDQMKNFLKSDIVWESQKEILVSSHPRKTTPLVLSCQRDPEAPTLSLINQYLLYLKKGNSGPEKIVLSLHKFPAVVFNDDDIEEQTSRWVNKCVKKFNPYARYGVEHWKNPYAKIFYIRKQKDPGKPNEVIYSNSKIIQVIKTYSKLGHKHKCITEIIARRANECIVSITELDFKNLNKNDIEDMYLLIMNGKVNLTALTISFLEIEKHEMFSIIYESTYRIIYKNSKKEKKVMRHSEIHKFCDAVLNRVLEGLKSYNNDVKYGYIHRDLTKDEVEYLKIFEEEIEVRLKYRRQMRRWESYVNGRPLGLRRERPE